jgi:hypothetical protein
MQRDVLATLEIGDCIVIDDFCIRILSSSHC